MNKFTAEQIIGKIDDLAKIARAIIVEHKNHDPISILYTEGGPKIIGLAHAMNESEKRFSAGDIQGGYAAKDAMAGMLKGFADKEKAFGIITIIEAWTKKVDPSELTVMGGDQPGMGGVVGPLPRFDKDRKEVLIISHEFRLADGTKSAGITTMEIIRDGDRASLGAPEKSHGMGDGRLTNIIQ